MMSLLVHCWAHWSRAFQEAFFPSLLEELGRILLLVVLALYESGKLGSAWACNSRCHRDTEQYLFPYGIFKMGVNR